MNSAFFRKIIFIHIVAVIVIALLSLAGWQFNIEQFKHPLNGIVAMNPLSSIVFLLCSLYFFLLAFSEKQKGKVSIARYVALLVALIGGSKMIFLIAGINSGLDTFLYAQKLKSDLVHGLPNAMAPNTSFNFLLTGLSLFLITFTTKSKIYFSHLLAAIILFISLLSIIGYLYGVHTFYGLASFIPMAFHTAICFFLISLSILFTRNDEGFMKQLTSHYYGGKIARVLLPAAITVPILLGMLRVAGERTGLYSTQYGAALFTVANIIIFVLFIWRSAAVINKSSLIINKEIEQRKASEENLRSNNLFLDTIVENLPNMVFVKDAKGLRFIRINKKTEELTGLNRNELIGKNDYDFFPKEQADFFTQKDREVLRSGKLLEIPQEKISTTNGEKWLQTTKIPVNDEDNKPLYLIGISLDITEKKKNEEIIKEFYNELELKVKERGEELYKSEKRFRSLIENAEDVISLIDGNGKTVYISPGIEKVTGFSIEERRLHSTEEIVFADDKEEATKLFEKVLHSPDEIIPFTFRLNHKNGGTIWVEGTLTNKLNDENVNAIVSNYHDINERKKAEDIIKNSELRYRMLFEQNLAGVYQSSIEGQILTCNNAFAKMLKYDTPDEVLQLNANEFYFSKNERNNFIGKVRDHQKLYNYECVLKCKDGSALHVMESFSLRRDVITGEEILDGIIINVNEKKIADDQLKSYYEELRRSNKELEQFAYIASHDLQEPLRMVSSFLQLLEKKYDPIFDETAKRYIHFALDGSERMKKLILDLLAYSRAGSAKESFSNVDLNDIAETLKVTFKSEIELTGGNLIIDKLPVIDAVKLQMTQLFQNLISNAIKYRGDKPPIVTVSATDKGPYWLFIVKDNGIGIEPRFYHKLFILFQRLHDKEKYSGTGIGLAICKKIVEAHGGKIWVESKEGEGSEFLFLLKKKQTVKQ